MPDDLKRSREETSDDESSDFGPAPAANPESGSGEAKSSEKKKTRTDIKGKTRMLAELPDQNSYERSYMHKDIVNSVHIAKRLGFLMTSSIEGVLKFWKKAPNDIIPVKTYRPHMGTFESSLSSDETWFATKAETADRMIKIFEVNNFDMINMIQFEYVASAMEFINYPNASSMYLAVAEATRPVLHIYDPQASTEVTTVTVSSLRGNAKITHLKYNPAYDCVIATDDIGLIEYFEPSTGTLPKDGRLAFTMKVETDLFKLARDKVVPLSLEISPNGEMFSIMGANNLAYIYKFSTGKQYRVYDESLSHYIEQQRSGPKEFQLEALDFGKRVAVEKDLSGKGVLNKVNIVFDDSNHFAVYSCLLGMKIVNLKTNKVERIVGGFENTERFISIALYQGRTEATQQLQQQLGEKIVDQAKNTDPTIFSTSWRRERFYLHTRRSPETDSTNATRRDVLNEKPSAEDIALLSTTESSMGSKAILRTTMGDIHIQLYPKEVPKTTENFVGHCRSGYYNNLVFHRVIEGFMVQTGCPYGDGTGGESIWGGEFADEFHPKLRHDRPFTVSMANAGINNNGSQFFITTVETKWLDDKHSVFGRVTKGMDVVQAIEKVRTIKSGAAKDKPCEPIRIINAEVQ